MSGAKTIAEMTRAERMAALDEATGMARIAERVRSMCGAVYEGNGNGGARSIHAKPMKCRECGKAISRAPSGSSGRYCGRCGTEIRERAKRLGRLAMITPAPLGREGHRHRREE